MLGDGNPRVRRELRYVRQVQNGGVAYVVKDPRNLKYFRFGEVEAWMMERMDGARSFARVAEEVSESFGIQATASAIEPFYRRLKELGLAERTQAERSLLLLERLRDQRRSHLKDKGNTLFRMRFSLGDPDELFNRAIGRVRFFWTPLFVLLSIAAFLMYALILGTHWGPFMDGVASLYDPGQYTLGFFLTFYLSAVVIIGIHELGHGLTCKYFGGEVHEIGAMLLYFSPALFCNVNDAWTFEKKSHRLWVTFAGGWIQLLIAAAAAVVWIMVEPHTWLYQLAFVAVLIGGGLALLLNYNPLIPLDGYYALMDWLEIPNLRARSFEHLGAYLKRKVLRLNVPIPAVTPRERRVFLVYGSLAFAYTSLILLMLAVWVAALVIGRIGAWGWVVVAVAIWALGRQPLRRVGRVLRVWAAEKRSGFRARRTVAGVAVGIAALVLVSLLVPWTVRAGGQAVIEPVHRSWVRPADPGWIIAVPVREGATVQAGDPVVVLRNPELELEWTYARAAMEALEREAAAARTRDTPERAHQIERRLAAQRSEFTALDQRRNGLVLRAPFTGRVVTPHTEDLVGAEAAEGDSLIELWSTEAPRGRVLLAERDAGEIAAGTPVGLRFPVLPGRTWRTRIEHISPAAHGGVVEAIVPLSGVSPGDVLRPGMVGRAKVIVERTNMAGALLRWLRHTVRTDWLL